MKRLTAFALFLVFFCAALDSPARAQTGQPPCTPAQWGPKAPIPPVAVLVATHACLLANYNPNDQSTDYRGMTSDLEQTGIGQLIAGPEGLPKLQRVQILNDYAFWQLQRWVHQGDTDRTLVSSISVLKLVLSLTPERGFAWLNLGDVYRAEMNDPSIPGANKYVPQTPQTQAAEAQLAVTAYKRYLALVHKPSQRVVNYVAFEAAPNPAAAAAWNTNDAIDNMVQYPAAASFVLASDNQELATLALAMDIGLLLPDAAAHKDAVNALLRDITPDQANSNDSFDGTAESFLPYLDQQAGDGGVRFPLTCEMVLKYPALIDATDPVWGGHRDDFNAYVDCGEAKYQLPISVQHYISALDNLSGSTGSCGGADDIADQEALVDQFFLNIVQLAPRFFLPPYEEGFDDGFDIKKFAIPPGAFPLQAWGETDIDSYKKAKGLGQIFFEARSDLAGYYQSVFGLSPVDAQFAALRAAWLLQDAFRWATGGTPDPLAEALLGHHPLAQVKAALAKESPAPAPMLFLAVEYPEALKLLLAQQPDLTVTTPIGKTVLMEAAKYNQLESVELLLAAGADVDAVSLAPGQIDNNSDPDDPYPGCWSLYNITHGSRTALMYAAANASLPVITALMAAGADPAAKDSTGATALDYLEGRGPVVKNSVLDAADFKTAAADLAGPRWKIPPPPRRPPPKPQISVSVPPPQPAPPRPAPPPPQPAPPREYLHPYKPGEIAL